MTASPVRLVMIVATAVWVQTPPSLALPGQTGMSTSLPSKASSNFSSCPYLTNVGATKVYPGRTVFEPESAVVDPIGEPYSIAFSSGGGFSNIYPVPAYQAAAVSR